MAAQLEVRFSGGPAVRRARENAGKTREHLAVLTGRSAQTVARWEQGVTRPPRSVMVVLADHLNLSLEDLDGAA